ncbi:ABC transporter ATP-binding protein [Pseudomonas denitrificans (nom. rej.)]|uniref:ABC transporter ATP-binding protein n=1 Tax=Pseudomonas denitrificans TaxID=43306 RepID=UPI003369CE09
MALARALAPQPQLLLLDEPFSNLDVELRRQLSHEVRDILKARGTSAVLVTHDQEEAFAVSDHVGVFRHGVLEQWDTPFNLYHEPQTPFVASFVGQGYFIRGQMCGRDAVQTELGLLRGNRAYSLPDGSAVDVLLRPDDLVPAADGALKARIVGKSFLGAATLYRLQLPTGTQLESLFPATPTINRATKWPSASPPSTWCCSRHRAAWRSSRARCPTRASTPAATRTGRPAGRNRRSRRSARPDRG